MPVKDYYKILELEPGAGDEAVKKNFRRLALRYHPDTNPNHKHAGAWYREIQEAYETLITPNLKQRYLQERWLVKSKGQAFEDTTPLTPEFIEKKCAAFKVQVSLMDHFRMDHHALQKSVLQLLNDDVMDALDTYPEPAHHTAIVGHLLQSLEPLEYALLPPVYPLLCRISKHTPQGAAPVQAWYRRRRQEAWWSRHQWWVIALATLLLCSVIIVLAG